MRVLFANYRHLIVLGAMTRVVDVEPHALLTVAGDRPERPALERRAEALGLAEHVHFAGYGTSPEKWFRAATVFAMPSRSEGIGMAAIEALVASVPVVSSDAGVLPAVVENGHRGTIVAGCRFRAGVEVDPAGFAKALLRILTDKGLGCQLGKNGRRRYEARFTVEKFSRRHEELYLEELKRVGRPRQMPLEPAES